MSLMMSSPLCSTMLLLLVLLGELDNDVTAVAATTVVAETDLWPGVVPAVMVCRISLSDMLKGLCLCVLYLPPYQPIYGYLRTYLFPTDGRYLPNW